MIFDLECTRFFEGNPIVEHWKYNNLLNCFYDPNGNNPFKKFKKENDNKIINPFWGKNTNFELKRKITTLYIHLGLNCNFHCKYCQQSDLSKNIVPEASIKKIPEFINKLKKAKFNISSDIVFWGGEPLVYWKILEKLIPELRKLYINKFSIITNGSLLDREKVKFFEKWNVNCAVSYDGKKTLRDYPVFNDPIVLDALKYSTREGSGSRIGILPCRTEYSSNSYEIKKELEEKTGHKILVCQHSIVRCNEDNNDYSKFAKLSNKTIKEIENETFNELNQDEGKINPELYLRFNYYRNNIIYGIPFNDASDAYCQNCYGRDLTVNLDGDILACMNYPKLIGGNLDNLKDVKFNCFYHWVKKKKCLSCHLINACHGTCAMIEDDSSEGFKISCENYGAMYQGFFRAIVSSLFGVILNKVTPLEETFKAPYGIKESKIPIYPIKI